MGAKMLPQAPRQYHGMSGTKEHRAWLDMKKRCFSDSYNEHEHYKDRGIGMCDSWLMFMNFYNDMGPAPSPEHTLDRIDNDGDYCKENCRWALQSVQQNNRSNNRLLTYKGRTQTMSMWAREKGITPNLLRLRLRRGWSVEEALEIPFGVRRASYIRGLHPEEVDPIPHFTVNVFVMGHLVLAGVA